MNNHRLSRIYALSMFQLGKELGVDIVSEMVTFNELLRVSNDLENLLFLEVFSLDEKHMVLSDLIQIEEKFSPLFCNFLFFLLQERRIGKLLTIFQELVVLDDEQKGFITGVIEGRDEQISPELQKQILDYLREKLQLTPKLHYQQNLAITAGYKITAGNYQIDSRVDRQLTRMKEQILNDYEEKL